MMNQVDAHAIMDGVATHTSRTLVGRDAELTEIASLLGVRPCPAGAPEADRRVLLSGDAGVGKTRLLTELRDLAFTEGWQVFAGHCLDFGDSALPYLPFSEVLGRLAADLPDVVDAVAAVHPALARLQPGRRVLARPTSGGTSPPAPRPRPTCSRRCTRCSRPPPPGPRCCSSSRTPTGPTSRPATCSASSSPARSPARSAVVASYRSDDLHRRHPLRRQVAEWSRIRGVERVQLAPLSARRRPRPDRRARRPTPSARSEIADIVDRAEGNAFFVEELVGAACGPGPLGARRPRRRAAGPARPARRHRPPGGPGRQRRRPQGLPRDARRGLRARRRRARRGPAQGRRDERPGRRPGPLRLPARPARRGGVRRPAARRAGPPARGVRRGAAQRRGPRHRGRAGPARPAGHGPADRADAPRSAPATRPARSAAPTRPRSTTSRRSSCSPTRAAATSGTATCPSWSPRPPTR